MAIMNKMFEINERELTINSIENESLDMSSVSVESKSEKSLSQRALILTNKENSEIIAFAFRRNDMLNEVETQVNFKTEMALVNDMNTVNDKLNNIAEVKNENSDEMNVKQSSTDGNSCLSDQVCDTSNPSVLKLKKTQYMHPSKAFDASEEVLKAKKLSVTSTIKKINKHYRYPTELDRINLTVDGQLKFIFIFNLI